MAIAIYARKSIEKENSISCETQIEYCKAMIKPDERNKKLLIYVDNGFSGGNVNRDGFQKMMRKIENGEIEKVLVYRLDRISRSLADFVNILSTFKQCGVEFVSTQEAFDTSSPYGELIVKILAVFAEFERQSIISRITQAYEHRSKMGFFMGGRKPYGYDFEPVIINNVKTKRLTPNTKEIEHIKYIYALYAQEKITLGKLVKKLAESEMKPVSGCAWTTAKLSGLIKNPIYVMADSRVYDYLQKLNANIISAPEKFDGIHGLQLYGKTKHKADNPDWSDIKALVMTHEGVIDSETWIKCQEKLSKNKQIRNAVSNKTSFLSGKIICGCCGRTMTTIKGKTAGGLRIYFKCTAKTNFNDCAGIKATIYAKSLEDMVYREISVKLRKLNHIKIVPRKVINPEVNQLYNRLKSIEISERKLADTAIKPEVERELLEILNKQALRLNNEKKQIMLKLEELNNKGCPSETEINMCEEWENASFDEKRGVFNILVNRIIICENGDAEIVWNI